MHKRKLNCRGENTTSGCLGRLVWAKLNSMMLAALLVLVAQLQTATPDKRAEKLALAKTARPSAIYMYRDYPVERDAGIRKRCLTASICECQVRRIQDTESLPCPTGGSDGSWSVRSRRGVFVSTGSPLCLTDADYRRA